MNEIILKSVDKIEFHFFLNDESHSMDARVLHLCNNEALSILSSLSDVLGIPIKIETVALGEGGLKQVWKFIGNNSQQLTLIVSIMALIVAVAPIPKKLSSLEEENLELQNEKLRLEITELKEKKNGDAINSESINELSKIHDIALSKSKYYETMSSYSKVKSIEYYIQDENEITIDKFTVQNEEFINFINEKKDLPEEEIDNAIIEIIAPVLIDTKYKWKGYYEGDIIDFFMNDFMFKNEIQVGVIKFQAGFKIRCKLLIRRKIDESGQSKITSYAVDKVNEVNSTLETRLVYSTNIKQIEYKAKSKQKDLEF